MFDKQIQLRMGQANVKRWVDEIMPLLDDDDLLGVETFATHRVPLAEAPSAYETFQKKEDGAVKVRPDPVTPQRPEAAMLDVDGTLVDTNYQHAIDLVSRIPPLRHHGPDLAAPSRDRHGR